MGSSAATRRAGATVASGIVLTGAGIAIALAWSARMWASLTGAVLAVAWIVGLTCWAALRGDGQALDTAAADDAPPLTALLDHVPIPLLRLADGRAWAINRAARTLFGTDDHILAPPPALLDPAAPRLRQAARDWRIDAVDTARAGRLVALVDIDAADRSAEDRATEEMIHILGHELLNGLSPIVSLADSAVTAHARGDAMLGEVLATLARRVEGLESFTRAYRGLADLPAPACAPVPVRQLADDLLRLFRSRFPDTTLTIEAADAVISVDRAQVTQAVWALLQNAAEAVRGAGPAAGVALAMTQTDVAAIVEVSDGGAGIAAPDRAAVFRPFHTTKRGGSGIGLALARRIARAHGGDLTLLPTRRTTFRISLPSPAPKA